jgi:hypothetical protein
LVVVPQSRELYFKIHRSRDMGALRCVLDQFEMRNRNIQAAGISGHPAIPKGQRAFDRSRSFLNGQFDLACEAGYLRRY